MKTQYQEDKSQFQQERLRSPRLFEPLIDDKLGFRVEFPKPNETRDKSTISCKI